MRLIKRSEWGARSPRHVNHGNLSAKSTGHWNGPKVTIGGKTSWDHAKCPSLVRGIQNFHMDSRGWSDIAYNFVICPHGAVFEGRGLNVINGANGTNSGNRTSHACMWLSGEGNPFTNAEKSAFRELVSYIDNKTAAPNQAIGHRDHKSTECPGDERYRWIHSVMPVNTDPGKKDYLTIGDEGEDVGYLQAYLNICSKYRINSAGKSGGAQIPITKKFDNSTRVAVGEMQRFLEGMWNLTGKHGPKPVVNGVADKNFLKALGEWTQEALK